MRLVTLATCNLAQWALDFSGNCERIIRSIEIAKQAGASYRIGPELEITGYGCEDHFGEEDTYFHSWQVLAKIIKSGATQDIICDIGMPVTHKNVRYNCRVFVHNAKILLIRPKIFLADDGNYREPRWFSAWKHHLQTEDYYLPSIITEATGQTKVLIGEASIATLDTVIASETCEELFTPASPHIYLGLNGIEIISNGSGSHHQLRKLHTRIDLMKSATAKGGGVYLYANQQGCDGGRLYFDGCAMIVMNGEVLAQGSQFSLKDVEVVTATVNLDDIRSYRGGITSRGIQAAESQHVPRIDVAFSLHSTNLEKFRMPPTKPQAPKYVTPEEEIGYGPACWLWDYLRRSGMNGFFLPLSGGADSSAVASMCAIMCELIVKECQEGNSDVKKDIQRVLNQASYDPQDPKDLCNKLLFTCYMGTKNSSEETRSRAEKLANQIGAHHMALNIDDIVNSFQNTFISATSKTPQFKVNGGTHNENLALQNIQARSRMVMSYFLSQLLLWTTGRPGSLLVLGTANVDEALRGYFTKYDCSSADINPIGGISKTDLKRFLQWAAKEKGFSVLEDVEKATPTAELEPTTENYVQSDEVDMGMTYQELSVFGRLRKIQRCGPYSMFEKLLCEWIHLEPKEVADKVKRFFFYYSINRHKMTILTPSYHAESYSPDDNRFDLRQFLYNSKWTWQFEMIDKEVAKLSGKK